MTSIKSSSALQKLIYLTVAVSILLMIPFIAMKFTDEVQWTGSDFLAAGLMLLTAGLIHMFLIQRIRNDKYRRIISFALIALFLIIWVELAVGIFN